MINYNNTPQYPSAPDSSTVVCSSLITLADSEQANVYRVRLRRKQLGLCELDFSDVLGIAYKDYMMYELGQSQNPQLRDRIEQSILISAHLDAGPTSYAYLSDNEILAAAKIQRERRLQYAEVLTRFRALDLVIEDYDDELLAPYVDELTLIWAYFYDGSVSLHDLYGCRIDALRAALDAFRRRKATP